LLRRGAFALTVMALIASVGADATPARSDTAVQAELSDLATARLLIRAGRLEHAHAFLEQAVPGTQEERIERLFLLGSIELRLGMSERAVERFEAILALRPELTRVRLELARAYYLAGRVDKARRTLRVSLADELPSSVEAAVESFVQQIDARRRWSVSLGANLLPETRRRDLESVLIGGVPFVLDEEARGSSGAGVLLSGGVSFSNELTDGVRGVLASSAAAKSYERSSWNETTVSGEVGAARILDQGTVSGGIRFGRVWAGGEPERTTLGPWARGEWRLSGSTRIDLALNADRRRHDTRTTRDGRRLALTARVAHAVNARVAVTIEPIFEIVSAHEQHHANRLFGVGARTLRDFQGGLAVTLGASATARRYVGPDPLFATRRIDRTVRVLATVRHRALRLGGFAPYIGVSLERNSSTIPVHEYGIAGVMAGVSRAF